MNKNEEQQIKIDLARRMRERLQQLCQCCCVREDGVRG